MQIKKKVFLNLAFFLSGKALNNVDSQPFFLSRIVFFFFFELIVSAFRHSLECPCHRQECQKQEITVYKKQKGKD